MKIKIYQGAAIEVPDEHKGIKVDFEVSTGGALEEVDATPENIDKYLKRHEFPKTKAEVDDFKKNKH